MKMVEEYVGCPAWCSTPATVLQATKHQQHTLRQAAPSESHPHCHCQDCRWRSTAIQDSNRGLSEQLATIRVHAFMTVSTPQGAQLS